MRKEWFAYVRKIRTKLSKKTKTPCSHREAMKVASETWEKEKQKILRKRKREARKASKSAEPAVETQASD